MTTFNENVYYDLHSNGLGYLNRIREVQPRKGKPFLACDIAALTGPKDNVSYVRFDARVSGTEAQHLVRRCIDAVEAKKKVLIGFRVGDLWVDMFTYSKGKNAGKPGVSLKVRLLFIGWIKIDGKLVYKAEPRPTATDVREVDVPEATDVPVAAEASSSNGSKPIDEAANEAVADAPALAVADSF